MKVYQHNLHDFVLPQMKDTHLLILKSIRDIVREEISDVVREVVEEYLDKSLVTEDIKIKIGDTVFGGKLKPLPTKKKKRV